jgi:hypothetical protein
VAFVPQSYDWGQEAQVDWFEAVAKLEVRIPGHVNNRSGEL